MAKVLSVSPDERGKKYHIDVDIDGKSTSYTVSAEAYAEIGLPTAGDELDEYSFGVVCFEHESFLAIKKAYSLLASRDRSRREIRDKLTECGFSFDASLRAVERLAELGYIDEADQIARAVLREANVSLRGPRLIVERLRIKGYDSSDIRRTIKELTECGEIDFKANFERLAEKKKACTDEKRYALKYRYGYGF